jgi:3-oxoacyl-[acyl-carrier protein] reductase
MRLKDKVAIVTGGGRGIGRATCIRFVEEGAKVAIADLDLDVAKEVSDEIDETYGKGKAIPVAVDVSKRPSVSDMVQVVLDQFGGRIDVLVNNAGTIRDSQLLKMTEENFDLVIAINLKGVFNCAQAVAPTMVQQKSGSIINTSSLVAPYGNYGQSNYVASKAGVVGMTKVWARELGPKGIRSNAIAPGFIKTRLTAGIPDKVTDYLLTRISLRTFGEPVDIANGFVFLASDDSKYVSGHVLAIDGGATL